MKRIITPEQKARHAACRAKRREDPVIRERDREWNRMYAARRRAADPEKARTRGREEARKHRYKMWGIDPAVAEKMRLSHDGKCDCCGSTDSGGTVGWCLDHEHSTGRIRGMLCCSCNLAIGKLGDTLEGVLNAVKYLQRSVNY